MPAKDEPGPRPENAKLNNDKERPPKDLERCPRCGIPVEDILWGHTDCPNCGLHFECC